MRWKGRERSENVEDRRGISPGMAVGGGGIGLVLVVIIAMLFGADGETIKRMLQSQQQVQQPQAQQSGANAPGKDDEMAEFISVILKDTETVWSKIFSEELQGGAYRKPTLVIFSGQVMSGCGAANAQMGPFYCPADQKVYIDPTFFNELATRHKAPGDFARAFVIAHEVGHHVQNLLGLNERANAARRQGPKEQANRESVRLELQADYLAGVWAHHIHKYDNVLEEGDILSAITAAAQIGDDVLTKGQVPESYFTHGKAEQRMFWFKEGLRTGDFRGCQRLLELPFEEL